MRVKEPRAQRIVVTTPKAERRREIMGPLAVAVVIAIVIGVFSHGPSDPPSTTPSTTDTAAAPTEQTTQQGAQQTEQAAPVEPSQPLAPRIPQWLADAVASHRGELFCSHDMYLCGTPTMAGLIYTLKVLTGPKKLDGLPYVPDAQQTDAGMVKGYLSFRDGSTGGISRSTDGADTLVQFSVPRCADDESNLCIDDIGPLLRHQGLTVRTVCASEGFRAYVVTGADGVPTELLWWNAAHWGTLPRIGTLSLATDVRVPTQQPGGHCSS